MYRSWLPREWVKTVGELRLPAKANQRLQQLMDRNNEELLLETERADLVLVLHFLAVDIGRKKAARDNGN